MKFVCTRLKQLDASILLAINLVSIVLVAMSFHRHPGFGEFSQRGDLDIEWCKKAMQR